MKLMQLTPRGSFDLPIVTASISKVSRVVIERDAQEHASEEDGDVQQNTENFKEEMERAIVAGDVTAVKNLLSLTASDSGTPFLLKIDVARELLVFSYQRQDISNAELQQAIRFAIVEKVRRDNDAKAFGTLWNSDLQNTASNYRDAVLLEAFEDVSINAVA